MRPRHEMTYRVIRFYADPKRPCELVRENQTLEEAMAHCNDPETSSRTATDPAASESTDCAGEWFDMFLRE